MPDCTFCAIDAAGESVGAYSMHCVDCAARWVLHVLHVKRPPLDERRELVEFGGKLLDGDNRARYEQLVREGYAASRAD